MISKCNNATKNNIISVSENRRKFIILNNSKFLVNEVKVDGCYILNGAKCDFLFEVINSKLEEVFYVELKGSDISHAVEQLEATILKCLSIHKDISRKCFIVASKFPKSGTSSQVMKKKFLSKNKIQLLIDTNIKEIKI